MDLWTYSKHCLELEKAKNKCGTIKTNTPESVCRPIINGFNDCSDKVEADEALIFTGKDVS